MPLIVDGKAVSLLGMMLFDPLTEPAPLFAVEDMVGFEADASQVDPLQVGNDLPQRTAFRHKKVVTRLKHRVEVRLTQVEVGQFQSGVRILKLLNGVDIGRHVTPDAVGLDKGEHGEFPADVFPVDFTSCSSRQAYFLFFAGIVETQEEVAPAFVHRVGGLAELTVQLLDVARMGIGKVGILAHVNGGTGAVVGR